MNKHMIEKEADTLFVTLVSGGISSIVMYLILSYSIISVSP